MRPCFEVDLPLPEEKRAEEAKNEQFPFFIQRANCKALPSLDMSHGLNPEGKSFLVMPDGYYMDSIL
jgi:hypothetical protein